jgi:uncharacterized integral membrane protein
MLMSNLAIVMQKFIKEFTVKNSRGKRKACWVSIIGALMIVSLLLVFVMALVGA